MGPIVFMCFFFLNAFGQYIWLFFFFFNSLRLPGKKENINLQINLYLLDTMLDQSIR